MFSVSITPRFCETDALGHINNTVMPVWLEQGRTPVFELFVDDLNRGDLEAFPLLLAHLSMDFRRIVWFGSPAQVHTEVKRIGNTSFDLGQRIVQDGACCVEAKAVIVHVDTTTNTSAPLPETARKQLTTWMQTDTNRDID